MQVWSGSARPENFSSPPTKGFGLERPRVPSTGLSLIGSLEMSEADMALSGSSTLLRYHEELHDQEVVTVQHLDAAKTMR